jgi:hypothetical protein
MPVIDARTNAATMGDSSKRGKRANECYLINAGNAQNEPYDDTLVSLNGEEDEPIQFDESNISTGVPPELAPVLEEYRHVFSEVSGLGKIRGHQLDISLVPGAVPYRMSWEERELLEKHLQELLALDVIEPSNYRIIELSKHLII